MPYTYTGKYVRLSIAPSVAFLAQYPSVQLTGSSQQDRHTVLCSAVQWGSCLHADGKGTNRSCRCCLLLKSLSQHQLTKDRPFTGTHCVSADKHGWYDDLLVPFLICVHGHDYVRDVVVAAAAVAGVMT